LLRGYFVQFDSNLKVRKPWGYLLALDFGD
jgi:hypothetical protein